MVYDLLIKLYFRSNSPCITYLFLSFKGKTVIQMLQICARLLQVPVVGRPAGKTMGRSKDVHEMSIKHIFKIQLTNSLNLH